MSALCETQNDRVHHGQHKPSTPSYCKHLIIFPAACLVLKLTPRPTASQAKAGWAGQFCLSFCLYCGLCVPALSQKLNSKQKDEVMVSPLGYLRRYPESKTNRSAVWQTQRQVVCYISNNKGIPDPLGITTELPQLQQSVTLPREREREAVGPASSFQMQIPDGKPKQQH